jgi:hypothetical protein
MDFSLTSIVRIRTSFRPSDCPDNIQIAEKTYDVPLTATGLGNTDARAWCFQETVLPDRVVVYGRSMMGWVCNEKRMSQQDGDLGCPDYRLIKTLDLKEEGWRRFAWSTLIIHYTQRQLTREEDKLPAFSGIATIVQNITKDRYLAGLWESDLTNCLLWKVIPSKSSGIPKKYRAPSWSWASVNGAVVMVMGSSILPSETELTKVLACEVQTSRQDVFGEVTGGYVRLSGPLVELFVSNGQYYLPNSRSMCFEERSSLPSTQNPQASTDDHQPLTCHFDNQRCKLASSVLYLGIKRATVFQPVRVYGLLLVPSEAGPAYSRVGIATLENSDFEGYTRCVITVI